MQNTLGAMVNTDFYMETLNLFTSIAVSFIFLSKPPVVSDKCLKLLSACFKSRIQRGHNNVTVVQSVFSSQIAQYPNERQMLSWTVKQQKQLGRLHSSCEESPLALKSKLFSQLGTHPEETANRFSQIRGTAHSFQIRNSPWSLKQRKSSSFPTVSQMNHFSPRRD